MASEPAIVIRLRFERYNTLGWVGSAAPGHTVQTYLRPYLAGKVKLELSGQHCLALLRNQGRAP